jgi:TM2 domain-containing membrane protein YozV
MAAWASAGSVVGMTASAIAGMPPVPPPLPTQELPSSGGTYSARPSAARSRVAYVLLGLFLGGFGIHNFYAGYTGRAIAQLLITLLTFWMIFPLFCVAIWVLVEIISVKKDAQGVAFS